nr:unnamed protein product [Callosobruchus chinensis]
MLKTHVYLILLLLVRSVKLDEYVKEALAKCNSTRSTLECTKYNLLKYIKRLDLSFLTDVETRVPRRKDVEVTFPNHQPDDPELLKFVKFLVRKVISIVASQAVEIGLFEDDESNDEDLEAKGNSTALSVSMRKHRDIDLPTRLLYGILWFVPVTILSNLYMLWTGSSIILLFVAILQNALFVLMIYVPVLLWRIKTECQRKSWLGWLFG